MAQQLSEWNHRHNRWDTPATRSIYYIRQQWFYDNVNLKSEFLLFSVYFMSQAFKRAPNLSLNSHCCYKYLAIIKNLLLSPYTWYVCLDTITCAIFFSLSQQHHPNSIHSSEGVNLPGTPRAVSSMWKYAMFAWRAVHKNTGTKLQLSHHTQSSTYATGLTTPLYIHSIHMSTKLWFYLLPSLHFLHQHLLAIWYSSILSTYSNHFNTLCSTRLASSISIPALLYACLHS